MATPELLVQSTVRHQVYLEGLKAGEVNQFTAFLKRIDKDLREKLTRSELTEYSRERLEKLLKSVDSMLAKVFDDYYDELAGHLTELAEYEASFEAANLNNVLGPSSFEAVIPAPTQVHAAIFSAPLSVRGADGGKLLEPFIRDWAKVERKRVVGAIRQGVFEGQTNGQIIQKIRGTRAAKFSDGILAISSRHAESIVRTSVQHASTVARFKTWEENSDIINGYKIVATLDGKTSTICRSLDSQVFGLGKGPIPPLHVRCRSTIVPELDERYAFLKEGATRASENGPVDANETYYSWLKKQSAEFQDDTLGPSRGNLLRRGGLSAEKFAQLNLSKNFKPLTLAEMRHKEPAAFGKADEAKPLTKQAEKVKVSSAKQRQNLTNSWMSEKEYRIEAGRMENPRIKKQTVEYALTQPEQVAIGHYTGTGYFDLNGDLFNAKQSTDAKLNGAANVLRDGLAKLPSYEGQTIRRTTLPASALEQHQVGNVVEYQAFTSATFGQSDVLSDNPHRLVIHSLTGKKVDWISRFPLEKEVLYTSPTKFDVINRYEENGVIHIELMELKSE